MGRLVPMLVAAGLVELAMSGAVATKVGQAESGQLTSVTNAIAGVGGPGGAAAEGGPKLIRVPAGRSRPSPLPKARPVSAARPSAWTAIADHMQVRMKIIEFKVRGLLRPHRA